MNERGPLATWLTFVVAGLGAVGFAGCSGSGDTDSVLSEAGASGREIANSNGCAGCHGSNGEGGVGPTWVGLYGSDVLLADGTTVLADQAFLTRAIVEPNAEIVEGYTLKMPSNGLNDDEVADVVAYIRDLAGLLGPP